MVRVITFSPLRSKLQSINMTLGEFQNIVGLGSSTMTKLRNDECVTTDTILKISNVLNCELNEIITLKEK